MKLELRHLSPYLPYKLDFITQSGKVFKSETKDCFEIRILKGNSPNGNKQYHSLTLGKINRGEFKPILRPLSDLNKDKPFIFELRNQENNDTLLWAVDQNTDESFISHYNNELTFSVLDYLYKNHFDIFNLIENNLAIDINTIK